MLITTMSLSTPKPARADTSIKLFDVVGTQPSDVPSGQSTNFVYATNTVQVSYSSGLVTLSMCPTQACVWAIDDAITLTVTHEDNTQSTQFLESYTHDQEAEDVTSLFQTGVNTVTAELVDLMGPERGLSQALYLIGSLTQLSSPVLNIESLPADLQHTLGLGINYSSDPVSTYTGSYTYVHTDISIAGRGPAPTFVRTYNSSDTSDGPMGVGWTFNYGMHLASPSQGSEDVVVIGPEGRGDLFTHNVDGSYTPPVGIDSALVKNTNGTYTVTNKAQTIWSFDETGKLLRITDRYGNQSTLSYDGDRLISVSDSAGRGNLTFSYNGSDRISSVTDWVSRTVSFGYDGNDRLSTVTDRENNTTTYGYEGTSQRLTTITDAQNHTVVTNVYDGAGKVASQQDASGLTTGQSTVFTYTVNVDNTRVTTVTYPVTSFDAAWRYITIDYYDTQGRVTKHVDKPVITATKWITEEYGYTAEGFRSSIKDGRGITTTFCYDVDYGGNTISGSRGNLTRKIEAAPTAGANMPVTLYKYDSKNNLVETISPKGVSAGTSATCATNLANSTNALYATEYGFDAASQTKLISTTVSYTDPDLGQKTAITKFEYNDTANPGLVSAVIPPRGNTSQTPDYSYAVTNTYGVIGANAGMLLTVTSPLTSVVSYDYDAVGRRTKMVDANGYVAGANPISHTWEYVYDDEDRLRFSVAPTPTVGGLQSIVETRYDGVGNKTVEVDPLGQVTAYVYDERDNLKEVHQSPNVWTDPSVHPAGEITTTYLYDSLGNLTRTLRATGSITYEEGIDYVYDGLGRVRKETQYPGWPSTSTKLVTEYSYDKSGNKVTMKDPLGTTTEYRYDFLNRMTSVVYTSATTSNVTYAFDLNNNRTSMADGTGTTTYAYDELSRLITVTSPGPKVVAYRYDLDGNRRKLIYPDQTVVTYTFDLADRLSSLTDWANRTTSYQYNVDGSLKHADNVNGTSVDYTYDYAGRLTQVWNKYGNNTVTQHSYTLNAAGNITRSDEVPSQSYGWDIEPITQGRQKYVEYTYDRMNRVTQEHNTVRTDFTVNYTYDPLGNRLSKNTGSATNYTYDKTDRLQTVTGQYGETVTVDANGNLTYRNSGSGITFTFDQVNRLVTRSDIRPYTYTYDGDGKLVQWAHSGQTKSYVYDVNQSLPQILQLIDSASTYKYVYGLGLAYSDDGTYGPFVYHYDGLGSMRSYTDNTRHWVMMYRDYDAYGMEVEASYDDRFAQPFKFTGELKDDTTNYYNLRARYYDSKLGRFVSRDPFAGTTTSPLSLNRYSYVENNPVNRVDHSGLCSSKILQSMESQTSAASASLIQQRKCGILPKDVPANVNIELDMIEAAQHKGDLIWFKNKVQNGGDWDFKNYETGQYEEFGNFHYGVVGRALGLPEVVLLWAAGNNQMTTNLKMLIHGDLNLQPSSGNIFLPPFGDDPKDQYWIDQGYNYCSK